MTRHKNFSLSLTLEGVLQLEKLARLHKCNKADVLRKAVRLLDYLTDEVILKDNRSLWILDAGGEHIKEVDLSDDGKITQV